MKRNSVKQRNEKYYHKNRIDISSTGEPTDSSQMGDKRVVFLGKQIIIKRLKSVNRNRCLRRTDERLIRLYDLRFITDLKSDENCESRGYETGFLGRRLH